jgi:hypothetical protein
MQYQGDNVSSTEGVVVFTADVSLANRNLTGVNTFTQNIGNVTFNDGQTNNIFSINTVSLTDAYKLTMGPTASDENANYKIPLLLGSNDSRVGGTLATTIVPTTNYPQSVATRMWVSTNAKTDPPTLSPNQFEIGQTIEIDIVGRVDEANTGPSVALASFITVFFSPFISLSTNDLNFSAFPASFSGVWRLNVKATRPSTNQISIGAAGYFENNDGSMKIISIPNQTVFFDPSVTMTVDVKYTRGFGGGNPGEKFDYVAHHLNMFIYK